VETLASTILLMVSGKLAAAGDFRAIREKLDQQAYRVRVVTDSPRKMAAALAGSDDIDSVSIGEDGPKPECDGVATLHPTAGPGARRAPEAR
jgi:ABC-2 type transport system ATP-binding protein